MSDTVKGLHTHKEVLTYLLIKPKVEGAFPGITEVTKLKKNAGSTFSNVRICCYFCKLITFGLVKQNKHVKHINLVLRIMLGILKKSFGTL